MTAPKQDAKADLLPCPFCGAKKAAHKADLTGVWLEQNDHDQPAYWVACWSCCAHSDERQTPAEAIAAWNRRASPKGCDVELREAVARIVDPKTFALIEHYTGIDRLDGLTPVEREPALLKGYPDLQRSRDVAYSAADAILALINQARQPEGGGPTGSDGLHDAIVRLKSHVQIIQTQKRHVADGGHVETNAIIQAVNDLPDIVRALESAEFLISSDFERLEEATPTDNADNRQPEGGGERVIWGGHGDFEPTEAMISAGLETCRPGNHANMIASFKEMMLQASIDGLVSVATTDNADGLSDDRAVASEVEVQYEVWQDDALVAASSSLSDAQHYAVVYGQDGPVGLFCATTTRTRMNQALAALGEGE